MEFSENEKVEILERGIWVGPFTVTGQKHGRTASHLVLSGDYGPFEHYNDAPYNTRSVSAWIVVERENDVPLLVGPYDGPDHAALALTSELINLYAEENATDVFTVAERPTYLVVPVAIDPNNPDHTLPAL